MRGLTLAIAASLAVIAGCTPSPAAVAPSSTPIQVIVVASPSPTPGVLECQHALLDFPNLTQREKDIYEFCLNR